MKNKQTTVEWVPVLEVPRNATLGHIRAAMQAAADDLQKFAKIDSGIPARKVLDELREIQRKESKKRKKKR